MIPKFLNIQNVIELVDDYNTNVIQTLIQENTLWWVSGMLKELNQ